MRTKIGDAGLECVKGLNNLEKLVCGIPDNRCCIVYLKDLTILLCSTSTVLPLPTLVW